LGQWDSKLLTLLQGLSGYVSQRDIKLDLTLLPEGVRRLLALSQAVPERAQSGHTEQPVPLLYRVGEFTLDQWRDLLQFNAFVGVLFLSLVRLLRGRASFRGIDLLRFLQSAGPEALPTVTLIGVGPVQLAGYLVRPQIVTRSTAYRLTLHEFDRWAGTLQENTVQVLRDALQRELPDAQVIGHPWHSGVRPDYQLLLSINRFEREGGRVRLGRLPFEATVDSDG
jgi:hypothetical protein